MDAPDLVTVTNTSLLEGLRDARNETVWRLYVDRYRPLIVGFASRLGLPADQAEDVAQTTLFEFSRSYCAGKYDRARGRLRAWLFGIARHQARQWQRRQPRRERQLTPGADESDFFEGVADPAREEEAWEREWREAVLRQCVDEIRREVQPKTVRAFELFALDGLPAERVAAELEMSPNAVFGAKRRVLQRVREILPLMEDIW